MNFYKKRESRITLSIEKVKYTNESLLSVLRFVDIMRAMGKTVKKKILYYEKMRL